MDNDDVQLIGTDRIVSFSTSTVHLTEFKNQSTKSIGCPHNPKHIYDVNNDR